MSACTALHFIFISFFLSKIIRNPYHVIFYILRVLMHQPASSFLEAKTGECVLDANEIIRMRETIIQIYVQRTGQNPWRISRDLERDFIMSAEEAHAYGIVDTIAASKPL